MNGSSLIRYLKRPRVIIAGLVVVFVAAGVVVDLPTNATQADRVNQATAYVKAIETDSAACRAALTESFTLETQVFRGHPTPKERASVPGLLRDDLLACSLTSNDIYDMEANQQAPGFAGGKQLGDVANALYAWETFGANHTIADLQQLLGPPTDLAYKVPLRVAETHLASEAAEAESSLTSASRIIGATFPGLSLPSPPPGVPGIG